MRECIDGCSEGKNVVKEEKCNRNNDKKHKNTYLTYLSIVLFIIHLFVSIDAHGSPFSSVMNLLLLI